MLRVTLVLAGLLAAALAACFVVAKPPAGVPAHVTDGEVRRLAFFVGSPEPHVPVVGVPGVGPSVGLTNEEIRRLGVVVPGPRGPAGCGWYDDDWTRIAQPRPDNCNPKP